MVNWYVDEGLKTLGTQWQHEHPGAVIYYIADSNHSTDPNVTQHAPDRGGSAPGDDKGEVDGGDFMPGKGGVTMDELRALRDDLVASRDPRLLIMIIDDQIVSSVVSPWKIRPYKGKRHGHLHVSVNDRFDKNTQPWDIDGEGVPVRTYTMIDMDGKLPELRAGDEDVEGRTAYIWRAQRLLGVEDDGVYGAKTALALAARMKGQKSYKPSSTNGTKLYEPEWRVLYALWS
jgi:hypothetical protein